MTVTRAHNAPAGGRYSDIMFITPNIGSFMFFVFVVFFVAMPNVYHADDVFDQYLEDAGSIEEAKKNIKDVVAENAPSGGGSDE